MIGTFHNRIGDRVTPKKQNDEFVPLPLYIEDWSYYMPQTPSRKDDEVDDNDVERGVVIIDLM